LLRLRLGRGKKKNDDKESDRGTNSHSFSGAPRLLTLAGGGQSLA
jgi:hypothetical protein